MSTIRTAAILTVALLADVSIGARSPRREIQRRGHAQGRDRVGAGTDRGRSVAITERRTLDNAETDNYRYGDPTFIAPAAVRFVVIDTETGQRGLPLGDRLVNVRQAEFSRDGKRLAVIARRLARRRRLPVVLVMAGPATGPLSAVAVKSTNLIAANSSLDWTLDGSRVVVSMRTPARGQKRRPRSSKR